jgi:tetratricopeptide (TPR) repeat protein
MTVTLPLVAGGAGLLVYLLTLNHWVSLESLTTVARVSGWLWQPQVGRPLTALLFYPFHWLPDSWIPLVLNVFHAACAAVVLTLLARSVALLRYDMPVPKGFVKDKQTAILLAPIAWMPPVLAVVLCALQLSFWEHATAATGEMIDLLIFAYVVRCLLELRIDAKQIWLSRAALAYGAGMANNWIMVGYLPVFILALVLLKGLTPFLDRRFLFRMALCGLAGMSLYLLLPAIQQFASHGEMKFWPALKTHLRLQKDALEVWRAPALRMLALSSILPFVLISIPWKSHTIQLADDTRLGVFIARATGHFVHAAFFVTSIWMAFDPPISPRALVPALPMLTFYYTSALIGGYCCGYFLLFHVHDARSSVGKLAVAGAWLLVAAMPLLLVVRNIAMISTTNGPLLRDFAKQIYADLPQGRSAVLADDWTDQILLKAEYRSHRAEKQPVILDTASLASVRYHGFMAEKLRNRWPLPVPTNRLGVVGPPRILKLVSGFQAQEPVVFLGPPFGYLFEAFAEQPRGFVHTLEPRPARETATQTWPASTFTTNEQIWEQRWNAKLKNLSRKIVHQPAQQSAWLRPHRNQTANFVGVNCSRSLDYWGVQMRRARRLSEAATWFQRAIEINPNNVSARINLEYTQQCQRGDTRRLNPQALRQRFGNLIGEGENWGNVLIRDGPVDEPTFLLRSGRVLQAVGNSRQAAGDFARSVELAPDWPPPKIWLAQSCLDLENFDSALALTDAVQASSPPQDPAQLAHLLHCRTLALMGLTRTNDAMASIADFLAKYPSPPEVLATAADLYGQGDRFQEQLAILEDLLKREPDRVEWLIKRGVAELQLSKHEAAIATLTKALSLAPQNTDARLSRAVAYLGADQVEAAQSDYEALLAQSKTSADALFGLGTVAWRQQNTNSAIRYYQQYLSQARPRSPQYKIASERLAQLSKDAGK